jgi:hypothetical protein
VQRLEDPGRRIGFDGVKNFAREIVLEPAPSFSNTVRTYTDDRTFYVPRTDQVQGSMVRVQFT